MNELGMKLCSEIGCLAHFFKDTEVPSKNLSSWCTMSRDGMMEKTAI